MEYPVLTAKERECINNLDTGKRGKEFGQLRVKRYVGNDKTLKALNTLKAERGEKTVGTTSFIPAEDSWYFYAINGKTYHIPEPAEGIDSVLDIEFKRKDV